jgi:glucose-6-phosphate 1-dehydrogenase
VRSRSPGLARRALALLALASALALPVAARAESPPPAIPAAVSRLLRAAPDPAPPSVIVLAGASGDLASRKVIPSIFELHRKGRLPDVDLVALTRSGMDLHDLDAAVAKLGKVDTTSAAWKAFRARIRPHAIDFKDPASVAALGKTLDALDAGGPPRRRAFYLSIPPSALKDAARGLIGAGLLGKTGAGARARVVTEKPFGRSSAEAAELNHLLAAALPESRIHRIDHYLGKTGVLELAALRFADRQLEPMWDRAHIERVTISATESIDIQDRGKFYEETGAAADFAQSHLMQLLAITAMDAPGRGAEPMKQAKIDVLRRLRPLGAADVVRGQYQGYTATAGVSPTSTTETYVALRAHIDSPRWRGVPFVLETGKALADKRSSVKIEFRSLEPALATRLGIRADQPAVLEIGIDPKPTMSLTCGGKVVDLAPLTATARQVTDQDPYERLIDAMLHGDGAAFVHGEEARLAWRYLEPIRAAAATPVTYPRGVARPAESLRLLASKARAPRANAALRATMRARSAERRALPSRPGRLPAAAARGRAR